jgi:hypothetical protein
MNTKSNLGWVLSVTQRRLSAIHLDKEYLFVAILLMNSLSKTNGQRRKGGEICIRFKLEFVTDGLSGL